MLNWRTLGAAQNKDGNELRVASLGECGRFSVTETEHCRADGTGRLYVVRDAERTLDADIRAGKGCARIGAEDTIAGAIELCRLMS